ncbi:preprotein translocase subunit SecG [bacterium]|nr:preprotein translocase subunit SecG [bacterium]
MTQQMVSILEIIFGIIGIIVVLAQNRSEQGSSFFGGGGDVFKLRKGVDRILFYATFIIIALLMVLIYLDIKVIS